MFLNQDDYDLIISDIHRVEKGISSPNAGYELLDALDHRKFEYCLFSTQEMWPELTRIMSADGTDLKELNIADLFVHNLKSS